MNEVYYSGLSSCFLTDSYKAAYNFLVADITARWVPATTLSSAGARRAEILNELGLKESEVPRASLACFLAQAFAEIGVNPVVDRAGQRTPPLCWYRVTDVVATCAAISEKDLGAVRAWLARVSMGDP
jgi:hypothetical protein